MTCLSVRPLRGAALVTVLVGAAAVASAAPPARPPAALADGTQRMAWRLEVIAETTNPRANIYVNSARLELFSSLPVPADARLRLRRDYDIANELLLSGRTEEAIAALGKLEDEPGAEGLRSLIAVAWLRLGEQRNCLAQHGPESCLLPFEGSGIHVDPDPARQALQRYVAMLKSDPDDLSARWLLNVAAMALGEHPSAVPAQFLIPAAAFESEHDIGRFREVAGAAGLATSGLAGGIATEDFDGDGDLDVVVSSAGLRDQLRYLRNDGDGTWSDRTREAGLLGIVSGLNLTSADYDNDGWEDLFVAGYATGRHSQAADTAADYLGLEVTAERPRLYRNLGNGTFEDVTRRLHLDRVAFTMGANFGDLDGDGFLDLYLGTGDPDLRALVPNRMFRNDGARRFQDVTTSGGFGHLQKGHGIAFADLDGDGDQDVMAVMGGFYETDVYPNVVFENPGHGTHWLTLKLEGRTCNRGAVGARVSARIIEAGVERDVRVTVGTGGSFGCSSLQQVLGLGRAEALLGVSVTWPTTGRVQRFEGLAMDRAFRLREDDPVARPLRLRRFEFPPAAAAGHHHHEH